MQIKTTILYTPYGVSVESPGRTKKKKKGFTYCVPSERKGYSREWQSGKVLEKCPEQKQMNASFWALGIIIQVSFEMEHQ